MDTIIYVIIGLAIYNFSTFILGVILSYYFFTESKTKKESFKEAIKRMSEEQKKVDDKIYTKWKE